MSAFHPNGIIGDVSSGQSIEDAVRAAIAAATEMSAKQGYVCFARFTFNVATIEVTPHSDAAKIIESFKASMGSPLTIGPY